MHREGDTSGALAEWEAASRLADSVLRIGRGEQVASKARAALHMRRAELLLQLAPTTNAEEAAAMLDAAVCDACTSEDRALELTARRRRMAVVSRSNGADPAGVAHAHLVRILVLQEDLGPAAVANPDAILDALIADGLELEACQVTDHAKNRERATGGAVAVEGGNDSSLQEERSGGHHTNKRRRPLTSALKRRARGSPSKAESRNTIAPTPAFTPLAAAGSVAQEAASELSSAGLSYSSGNPTSSADHRAAPRRILFVCEGSRGALLSLPAALLMRRHIPPDKMQIDFAVCDARNAGAHVWDVHRLCCEALPAVGCRVGSFVEARCLMPADLRMDTVVVAMDDTSKMVVHAHLASDSALVSGIGLPSVAVHATREFGAAYLSTKERLEMAEAVAAAEREAFDAALDAARRPVGLVLSKEAKQMEHSRTLALFRLIERGCTQFVQSERIPAREAAVLGEEPMPESTQPMAEEQPRLQRNEGRATMDVVSQQTEEMPWQEAHEEVQEEDAVQEEQQEAPFDLLLTAMAAEGEASTQGEPPSHRDDGLEPLLSSLGMAHHVARFRAEHILVEDLPSLGEEDLQAIGVGVGGRQRLARYLEHNGLRGDGAHHDGAGLVLAALLRHFGLQSPSKLLTAALRRAGVLDPLTLWKVSEAALVAATVPLGARRAVLKAGAATRELARLLAALEVADGAQILHSLFIDHRITSLDHLFDAPDRLLISAGLRRREVQRVRRWLQSYQEEAEAGSAADDHDHLSTPFDLSHSRRFRPSRKVRAEHLLSGDMQVKLAMSARPDLGPRLQAQIKAAGST